MSAWNVFFLIWKIKCKGPTHIFNITETSKNINKSKLFEKRVIFLNVSYKKNNIQLDWWVAITKPKHPKKR